MLSPQLRQKVFNLWSMFWASGMANPLTAIEQITYLLFLRQLEALDAQRTADGKPSIYGVRPDCGLDHPDDPAECPGHDFCRWSEIKKDPTHELFSKYVFPWLRELDTTLALLGNGDGSDLANVGQGIMYDAYFQFPREKAATLQRAIKTIDELFPQMDLQGKDLMGDIFEYLLDEIRISGKNGQFRTPRHIIRFMVELLDPQPSERVIDPAAGTGGFLFTTIQHLLKKVTPPEELRLEADGTPYRLVRGDPSVEPYLTGEYFTGYDNDRTMVRIGWMNLILHGIENPHIERRDSLGQSLPDFESGAYRVALANPPFTGNVDELDLHPTRFPPDPRKSGNLITTKSELLFVWLMLDLLEPGGRAAVIVPEGVLFGSTIAHKELRRQLLFEHNLQAVVSLPAGAFQPYAGVKTSILVFHKAGEKPEPGKNPRTHQVWFYEVQADGYTLDAKRNPQPESNDLWDALEKYDLEGISVVDSLDYHRPDLFTERWRVVDNETVQVFPDLSDKQGRVWGIHELFQELPADSQVAKGQVTEAQAQAIENLYRRYVLVKLTEKDRATLLPLDATQAQEIADQALRDLRRLFNEVTHQMLDTEFEQFGLKALKPLPGQAEAQVQVGLEDLLTQVEQTTAQPAEGEDKEAQIEADEDWQARVEVILREFAKLDGFDVWLRTPEIHKHEDFLEESRSWAAPVRVYARDDEWVSEDGTVRGTHDENDQVRPTYIEYLKQQGVFDENGMIKSKHLVILEPDCIEANDLNLSAGRYKPFVLSVKKYDPPADILRAVRQLESDLIARIDGFLRMVEGAE